MAEFTRRCRHAGRPSVTSTSTCRSKDSLALLVVLISVRFPPCFSTTGFYSPPFAFTPLYVNGGKTSRMGSTTHVARGWNTPARTMTIWMSSTAEKEELPLPTEMKLSEMQRELSSRGVNYQDCFDRESLTRRLQEARNGEHDNETEFSELDNVVDEAPAPVSAPAPAPSPDFDRASVTAELQSLRVAQLRGKIKEEFPWIRTVTMVEKQDLVEALVDAMEQRASFSVSGKVFPGRVADLAGEDLDMELSRACGKSLLLLDVYATWCGPCQMMAPQLADAAREMPNVRVVKMDSDRYPAWASRFQVGGLPTLILFNEKGQEVKRVEGAMMKDGLIQWVQQCM